MFDKLVVETNILYSFFWKNSPTHDVFSSIVEYDLIAPIFTFDELNKHKEEILFQSKIKTNEFNELMESLSILVEFVKESEYIKFINEAKSLFPKHLKDVDFFALALKFNCPLWSNERLHKKQSKVKVFNTDEIRELLGSERNSKSEARLGSKAKDPASEDSK